MGVGSPFSPPGLNLLHTKNSLGASHKDWLLCVITGWEVSGVLGKGISMFIAIYPLMAREPLQLYVPPMSL